MAGGLHPPPSVIATWHPNYINPETHGEQIVIVEIALLVLCFIVVAVRTYVRQFVSKSFGWDDGLIIFNLLPLTAMAISLCLAFTKYGWNRHLWDIPLDMKYGARKVALTIQLTYLLSSCTTKISILLFYRRLTAHVSKVYNWAIHVCITVVAGYCVAGWLTSFVGCRPFRAYWHEMSPKWVAANQSRYSCYDEAAYLVAITAISMVTDVAVCVLPMPLVIKLNMPRRKKIQLGAVFSFGLFLCICGLLRLVAVVRNYYGSYDHTWASEQAWLWTGIEAHLGVIAASAPAINYYFRRRLELKQKGEFSAVTSFGKPLSKRWKAVWTRRQDGASQNETDIHARLEDGYSRGSVPRIIRVTQHLRISSADRTEFDRSGDVDLEVLHPLPSQRGATRGTMGSAWYVENDSEDEKSSTERPGQAF